jgi:hypothetical protein
MTVYDVHEDLVRLASIKSAVEQLGREKSEVEARLLVALEAHGTSSVSTTVDGETIKGTRVAPQRVTIDPDKVKAALTAAQWKKVTKQVLDSDLLEAAVKMKEVDANVVAQASEVKDTKPYIKVSGKVPDRNLGSVAIHDGKVEIKNAKGYTKPAAKKRVVKPRLA